MIKVFLVDDQELIRTGIRRILEQAGDIKVAGEAQSGEEALKIVRGLGPDVVLMDLKMPGLGGIETTRRLMRLLPKVKVIALTVYDAEPFPACLSKVGARGYLSKNCSYMEMLEAIRTVHQGDLYVGSSVARKHFLTNWQRDTTTPFQTLSERELEVTMMILDGQRTSDIADNLSLSPKTVSTYRQRLYEKLNIKTDVELTRLAYRHGLIKDIDEPHHDDHLGLHPVSKREEEPDTCSNAR